MCDMIRFEIEGFSGRILMMSSRNFSEEHRQDFNDFEIKIPLKQTLDDSENFFS